MARTKVPLVMGAGLDRTPGLQAAGPEQIDDLRNIVLSENAFAARRGHVLRSSLANLAAVDMDDIIAIIPFKRGQKLVIVAWSRTDRKVLVFTAGSTGLGAAVCDDTDAHSLWFTAEVVVGRPIVFGCEANGLVFLAHYYHPLKPGATYLRGPTIMYDDSAVAGSKVTTLSLDLGGGAQAVRFAGVASWLNYVVGWGYGNKNTEDRRELIRVSDPENPTLFDPLDYAIPGTLGDATLNCLPTNGGLLVLKESDSYIFRGTERRNFGIFPTNDGFGIAGPRLGFSLGGRAYFWSLQGPRVSEGGESVDLAIPLNLAAPDPDDLADAGDAAYGHALYDPVDRIGRFYFPSEGQEITRVYSLHLVNPARPRWSYDEIGVNVLSSAVFFSAAPLAPAGHPDVDATTHTDLTSVGFRPRWVNTGNSGDETYEVWILTGAGWRKVDEGAVSGVGNTQTGAQWSGGAPGLTYDVAMRYRRGGLYNTGAEDSSNPAGWPAASRNTATTLSTIAAPTSFIEDHEYGPYLYGGKYNVDAVFTFDNPDGLPWELWEYAGSSAASSPPGGSVAAVAGSAGKEATVTKLVPPSAAAPGEHTYWLRFTVPISDWAGPVAALFTGP